MSTPLVRLRDERGARYELGPSALIGRVVTAACRIDDPRVSEAHAMISLRGGALHLLALRGTVQVDGIEEDDFPLEPGQALSLAPGVELTVEAVLLPDRVLALQMGALPPRVLSAPVYSLLTEPQPEIVPRYLPRAPARAWSAGEGWLFQVGEDAPQRVRPQRSWSVQGVPVHALALPLADAATPPTQAAGEGYAPLQLVVRATTVHVYRAQRVPALIDGLPGRLLSELALMGCPAPWDAVAASLWPEEADRHRLRRRWDRVRQRLQGALRELGIRENLVRTDNCGNFELLLLPGDAVVDEA